MSYSFAVIKSNPLADGSFLMTVTETNNEPTSEFTISVPIGGRIIRWKAYLSNNSGCTISPIMGESTNPSNENVVLQLNASKTSDGNVDEQPLVSPVYYGSTLYCRSKRTAQAGWSGTITHKIYIRPYWRR